MNKTLHINLNGFAFQIEEVAYDKLQDYLTTIESRLGSSEEAQEIITDIETRIAELFQYKFSSPEETITLKAVEEIIETIGEPAEIVDEEEAADDTDTGSAQTETSQGPVYTGRKGLYRDPDDRIFGGVCAGLGAYFDVDPLVFRIIAVVLTILSIGGVPIIYLILWAAMPKALTLSQRIEMRGGASFKNVENGIKNEYHAVSDKFKSFKNKQNYKNMQQRMNKTGDVMANALYQVVNVLGMILGLGIVIWSVLSIMCLVGFFVFKDALFGLILTEGDYFISELPRRFLSATDELLVTVSVLLLVGIPLLVILYLGMRLIFKFKTNGKALGMIGLGLWLSGLVLVFFTGLRVTKSFENTETVNEETLLKPVQAETIYLKPANNIPSAGDRDYIMDMEHLELFSLDGQLMIEGQPELRITYGDEFKLYVEKRARGINDEEARHNAISSEYFWVQKDSVLLLDRQFTIGEDALVRNQKVYVTVQLPADKKLEVSPYLDRLIDDF